MGLRPPQAFGNSTMRMMRMASSQSPCSSSWVRIAARASIPSGLSLSKARGARLSAPNPVLGGKDRAASIKS